MRPHRLMTCVAVLTIVVASGCTDSNTATEPVGATGAGLEIPESPYPPFPYVSDVQREAYASFLECAEEHGVILEGPFADSRGTGALLRLAPGQEVSPRRQERVDAECPQFIVALVTTPAKMLSAREFKKGMVSFARCLRSHGVSGQPMPRFENADPYQDLVLPLNWGSKRVLRAARACVDALKNVVPGP